MTRVLSEPQTQLCSVSFSSSGGLALIKQSNSQSHLNKLRRHITAVAHKNIIQ